MTDILGGAPEASSDETHAPSKPGLLSDPGTLAVVAFSLAVLALVGAEVFRGLSYTSAFAPDPSRRVADYAPASTPDYYLAGGFVTAAFSLLPLLLARRGLRRLLPEDAPWTGHLLRAAVVLAALSFVLRLIAAIVLATHGDSLSPGLTFISG